MTAPFRTMVLTLSIFLTFACCVSVGQTVMCERTDNSDQSTGWMKVTSYAEDEYPFFQDFDVDTDIGSGNTYATGALSTAAASTETDSSTDLQVTASSPVATGATASVPQVTLSVGGINDASAVPDSIGQSGSLWTINNSSYPFETEGGQSPAIATGQFQVLGSTCSATLYGTISLIFTANSDGAAGFLGKWRVECGSSYLDGKKERDEDGWHVTGVLMADGVEVEVDETWTGNVNKLLAVSEPTCTGNTHRALAKIVSLSSAAAANTWEEPEVTNSTLNAGFSFLSSFEVKEDE